MADQRGIPQSRFYMWRAVFAMAHVDGHVTQEEVHFADQYLTNAPFNDAQKEILRKDLQEPQNVGELLSHVTELSDQTDFFQFSHMLAWKDGDYSTSEQDLMERLSGQQMQKIDPGALKRKMQAARKAAVLRRAIEDEGFVNQASDVSGFANVIRFVVPWMEMREFEAPDGEMFKLWRAVFSLVHADDELADEERGYIEGMMDVFHFSGAQQEIVKQDLLEPPDTIALFAALKNQRHRKQFFVMARTIIWCDGIFHDKEHEMIEAIKTHLGREVGEYEAELRWIDRKPDAQPEHEWETGEEAMMKHMVRQMLDFYKDIFKEKAA